MVACKECKGSGTLVLPDRLPVSHYNGVIPPTHCEVNCDVCKGTGSASKP